MIRKQEGEAFEKFLQEVIDRRFLDNPALGITALVKTKGRHTLTPKQDYVFRTEVIDVFVKQECPDCGSDLEWDEMVFVYEEKMCPSCVNKMEKDD